MCRVGMYARLVLKLPSAVSQAAYTPGRDESRNHIYRSEWVLLAGLRAGRVTCLVEEIG